MEPKDNNQNRGLVAGYKPNRISLYILLLSSGRLDELADVFYKDMEKYKIVEEEEQDHQSQAEAEQEDIYNNKPVNELTSEDHKKLYKMYLRKCLNEFDECIDYAKKTNDLDDLMNVAKCMVHDVEDAMDGKN